MTESFLSPGTAKAEIIRYVEGHLLMEPIWGDHFYTMNDVPQVIFHQGKVNREEQGFPCLYLNRFSPDFAESNLDKEE